ncbi:MAG: ATP-binding cassette domain-containing protein [Chlorobi bacterium]|nr:ATP-binding cassette domain-containing protein [Chlorobiota bacterium]
MNGRPVIEVRDLRVHYEGLTLFGGLSFQIRKGEKVAVAGESGSGKSTLIHTLLGFVPSFEGQVRIWDMPLDALHIDRIRKLTTWTPQDLGFTVFPSVRELFFTPFRFKANRKLMPSPQQIREIFDLFELPPDILDRPVKEISGGQKQRLVLAISVLLQKPLMFLDEPTSALNTEIKQKITDFLLKSPEVTLLAATHDEYFLSRVSKVIRLANLSDYA